MKLSDLLAVTACILVSSASAEIVTVEFEMEASTVTGRPFGLDVPRLTKVSGFFSYDSATPDTRADPMRGAFSLVSGWELRAEFLGHAITGSRMAEASTETFGHTFRINDGGDSDDSDDMAFDGIASSDIALGFSFSGDERDLPSDQLPLNFRFEESFHTCTLRDDSGQMLLQFVRMKQVVPPKIKSIARDNDEVHICWCSTDGESYQVEFSTDLQIWDTIAPSITASGGTTEHIDPISARLDAAVPRGFYRVRLAEN